MHFSVLIDGGSYTARKDEFKKILRKHGVKWVGSPTRFMWTGPQDSVEAHYERDEVKDVTLSATLTWRGQEETPFLEEFRAWTAEVGAKPLEVSEDEELERLERLVASEMRFWENIHRPPVEELRRQGRPEEWIERDLERFEARRREKLQELRSQYGLAEAPDG